MKIDIDDFTQLVLRFASQYLVDSIRTLFIIA